MSKMAAMKATTPTTPASSQLTVPPKTGIRISITNQHGQRYRYHAQAVSLSMRKGVLQVVEDAQGCFVWFDQCNLEIRDGVRNLLFNLKTGAASNLPGAELTILAELVPSAMPTKKPRQKSAYPLSAAPLAS